MVRRILASSRFFIAIAVLGTFLSAVTLLVFGAVAVVKTAWDTIADGDPSADGAKHLSVKFVEFTDLFLLGTVLYIVALGLYELFVDADLPMPTWLQIHDLDELEGKLIGVIVVLLGVTFLAWVVDWDGGTHILNLGAAIALVIAAFALLMFVGGRRSETGDRPPKDR